MIEVTQLEHNLSGLDEFARVDMDGHHRPVERRHERGAGEFRLCGLQGGLRNPQLRIRHLFPLRGLIARIDPIPGLCLRGTQPGLGR